MSIPKLRFPEFKGEWKRNKLGALSDVRDGTHDTPVYVNKGLPLITSKNLTLDGKLSFEKVGLISSSDFEEVNKRSKVDCGDILFGMIGTIGNPVLVDRDDFAIKNIALIKEQGQLENKFLIWFLRGPNIARQFYELNTGGTQKFIALGVIRDLIISTPSIPEQKKIASFFKAIDDKISALKRKRDLLKEYKRGLMQKLFNRELRFTDDNGQPFPDWEGKRLGEAFNWVKTNNLSRKNLTYEKDKSQDQIQNIHYGDIHTKFKAMFDQDKENIPYITTNSSIKKFSDDEFCQKGDVIIADASEDYNDIGKAIEIINVRKNSLVAGLHTYIARPKNNFLVIGFSNYLLQSYTIRRQIMRIAQGISVLGVSKSNIAKIILSLPHPKEQQKIADALSTMDVKIVAVSDQVEKLEQFKKGLLQQMFV